MYNIFTSRVQRWMILNARWWNAQVYESTTFERKRKVVYHFVYAYPWYLVASRNAIGSLGSSYWGSGHSMHSCLRSGFVLRYSMCFDLLLFRSSFRLDGRFVDCWYSSGILIIASVKNCVLGWYILFSLEYVASQLPPSFNYDFADGFRSASHVHVFVRYAYHWT